MEGRFRKFSGQDRRKDPDRRAGSERSNADGTDQNQADQNQVPSAGGDSMPTAYGHSW